MSHSLKEANYSVNQVECEILQEYLGQPKAQSLIQQFAKTSEFNILVTPSGLVVQCCGNTNIIKKFGTLQMSKGTHLWEIIAIYDCSQMQIGVSTVSKPGQEKVYVQSFTASTIRTITVILNIELGEVNFYLNGNHNQKKTLPVEKNATYVPLVQFAPHGKVAALNPFAQHPNLNYPRIKCLPLNLFTKTNEFKMPNQVFTGNLSNIELKKFKPDQMIKISNNFIYFHNNKMKLLRPKLGQSNIHQTQLINLFNNKPETPQSLISIRLMKQHYELISTAFTWKKSLTNGFTNQNMIEQFHYYWSQAKQFESQVLIQIPYILMKQIVLSQLEEYESDFGLILKQDEQVESCKVLKIVRVLLEIDEQLYAMTLNNQEFEKFNSTTSFNLVPRIFSQFHRLHTFLDSNNYPYDIISLTELGLMKLPGFSNLFRHFTNYRHQIEPITYQNDLSSILPAEKIYNYIDIPLALTINNIPFVDLEANLQLVKSVNDSIYFSLINEEGKIQVWNGELSLHRCLQFNLRSFEEKVEDQNSLAPLFAEPQSENNPSSNIENQDSQSEEAQEAVVPNEDLLEQLYNMGFSIEASKQALIETKNKIEEAIEKVFTIEEQKAKEKQQSQQQEVKLPKLKPYWTCKECTLLNSNENLKCQACDAQPPQDAFEKETAIVIQEQQSEQQLEITEEKIQKIQEDNNEKLRNIFKTSKLSNLIQISLQKPYRHLLFAHVFTTEQQSYLVLNRFFQSNKYLGQFFRTNNEASYSILTNKSYSQLGNYQNLLKLLNEGENSRFIYETLYPVLTQSQEEFEFKDQIILAIDEIITNLFFQDDMIVIQGATKIWECSLFEGEDYQPKLAVAQKQEKAVITNQLEEAIQKEQAVIQQNEIVESFDDLTKLTPEEISDLAKLNEHQDVYFQPSSNNPMLLSQQKGDSWANIIVDVDQSSQNQIELNLVNQQQMMKLFVTGFSDKKSEFKSEGWVSIDGLKPEKDDQLPLTIFTHKGSQFNVQQCISKICFVQQEIFSTVYSKPEFIFKHLHGKLMSFSKFQVASPNKFQNTGVPLGSGLIFIGNNANDFLYCQKFSNFNKEKYQEWLKERQKDIRPLKPWEPVAFFELGANEEQLTFSLENPKIGKYVLLMTLSAKQTDQVKFEQNPLTLNYFVAYGTVVKENMGDQLVQSQQSLELFRDITLRVNGTVLDKDQCQFREDTYGNYNKYICEIPASLLANVQNIKIEFQKSDISFLQISGLKQKDINQKLLQKLPQAHLITTLMHDVTKYEEFNQKLMQLIHNNKASQQQRFSAIKVLCKLFQSIPQFVTICYKDLDILEFIKLNLLAQQQEEESSVQTFFQLFLSIPEFNGQLVKAVKDIINNIFTLSDIIKPAGFIQLLQMLKKYASQDSKEYYPYILSHLKQIAKFIHKVDSSYFNKLNQFQIFLMLTEEQLFSDRYCKLTQFAEDTPLISQVLGEVQKQIEISNKEKVDSDKPNNMINIDINIKKPLYSIIVFSRQAHYDEYVIDLLSQFDVHQFQLVFNTPQISCRVVRVTLFNGQTNQPILDVTLPDWLLVQLTKYADQHSANMPKSKLNIMQWNIKAQQVRTLKLQITYSLTAATRTKEESNIAPKELCIIPQFKGQLSQNLEKVGQDKDQIQSQVLFTDGDFVFEKEFSFPNSLKYQKYNNKGSIYLDSAQVLGLKQKYVILKIKESNNSNGPHTQIQSQYYRALLVQKQKELKQKLQQNQGKEKIQDTIQIIRKLQLELIQDPNSNINLSKSLDFLYTYAYELIKILIHADSTCQQWRSDVALREQEGLKMAQLIYKTFVQMNQGPITDLSFQLLNIILSNLNLKYWILFTFAQYQKIDQDANILNTLKILHIPICQTIMYISIILSEKQQIKQAQQLIGLVLTKLVDKQFNNKELVDPQMQIKPLGTLRSTSSQDLEIGQVEKLTDECFELTKPKVFSTLFCIMKWTLQNQQQYQIQDVQNLFLKTCNVLMKLNNDELIQFVTEITNPTDPTQSGLFQLLANALQSSDSNTILNQIKQVIEKLCTQQTYKLIFYFFQIVLNAIVKHANENLSIFPQPLDSSAWFQFLSFVVGQLLLLSNMNLTQGEQRQNQRKRSIKYQAAQTFQEFSEKLDEGGFIQICNIETLSQMIRFLVEPRKNLINNETLENSLTYWGLLLNLMSKIPTQLIMEHKIYDQLLSIYLRLDANKQAVIQFRFIEMTKSILEHTQSTEFNSNLIKQIFQYQGTTLIDGLLNIVASQERKINASIFKLIFSETAQYLYKYCNVGRHDGVYSCELSLLKKLQFGNKLLQLMKKAECPIKVQMLIQEIPQYGEIINKYIHWYMLNKSNVPNVTPATEILGSISKQVRQIFDWLQADQQLSTESLIQLFKFQKEFDVVVQEQMNQMTNILSYSLIKHTQEIFEELNELWMTTDQVVREIAINGNGFEYLLEKTHLTSSTFEEKTEASEQQPQEEEFANKLAMIDPQKSQGQSQPQVKDWQVNKKGVKAKVHVLTLKDELSEDYILEFQLEKPIELKQIKIGFQAYTPEYNDRILGVPDIVVVEVKNKTSDNLWYPIGIMTLIEDEAYTYYSVKVMALNVWRLTAQGNLNQQIKSLSQQPISYIRFIMKKPQITFLEQISQLSFKQYNNIQIGVSFISITGFDSTINRNKQIQTIQEKTASRLLGKMCSQKFRNTLFDISNNQNIVQQIKKSFKNISQALHSNESTLSPLFIGLTKYNPEFGDWVLEQIMDITLEWAHAKLTAEIVLQDKDKQLDRLKKFLNYILNQIKQIAQIAKSQDQFTQLTLLIEALTYAILISSKQKNKDPILLEVEEEDFLNILQAVEVTSQSYEHCNMIIRLFITLIKLPQPYVLNMQLQQTGIIDMTQQLLQKQSLYKLKLLSILVQVSNDVVSLIKPYLPKIFEQTIESLKKTDNTTLSDYFFFFDSSANVLELKNFYCENDYHLQVYENLKVSNPSKTLLKQIDQLTLGHIVNFIGKITLSNQQAIGQLAQKLIQDINLLSQIVDINYVENVLIPLLNFEEKIDFTIDIWDKESQIFVGDIRKLSSLHVQEDETNETSGSHELNGFQAKEFTPQYYDALQSAIQKVIKTNSLKKGGRWVKEMELSQGGSYFHKTLSTLQKGPFLILLFGKNNNQNENCIIGLFSTQKCGNLVSEFQHDYYPGEVYPIPENGEQFGFTYEKDKIYHLLNNDRKTFGVGMDHVNGGSFSFLLERINLTFSDDQEVSSISIGIHDFELLEQKPEEDYYFDDFWMQRMEIWIYQQPQQVSKSTQKPLFSGQQGNQLIETNDTSTFGYGILSNPILQDKYFAKQSVFNYLSATPVYSIPGNCNNTNILQCIYVSNMFLNEQAIKNSSIIQLNGTLIQQQTKPFPTFTVDGLELLGQLTSLTETPLQYSSSLKIFEAFQNQDGVKQIILAVQDATKKWQNQELTQIWNSYVSELSAFCSVPQFFSYFLKNKKSMELLFQLLAGTPDQPNSDQKAWKEKEIDAVKFIYDTLSDVFKTHNNQEIRIIAIKDNLIQKILDKIAIVSKEKKRVYQAVIAEEPQQQQQQQQPQAQGDKSVDRKPKKKQGVGYGSDQTGQNQKWNTQEYLDKKKVRSEQLKSLLEIIRNFFNYDNWHLNQELSQIINEMIFESALLSLLEAAFRSGSLLEMSKDFDLNLCYLQLTKTLAKHKNLTPLLLKIPPNYIPKQIESIAQLLSNLKNIAHIFLSCLQTNELSEKDQISKQIATIILETDTSVQEAIERFQCDESDNEQEEAKEHELQEILKLPLNEAYRLLLKDLRFDYVSFKGQNQQYLHYYDKQITQAPTPTPAKLIRLAQEFADMSNSLPVEHTNSIFVRADKDRVDVIKALIMGASGTPYAHGAYLFDIYFEDQYPNTPPKMNLSTTGSGKIRFNPNLYACGKVCLSLLGTWRGHASENWDPKLSTILQVLVSTQAIIMSEDVYFNEPGFEGEAGQQDGEMKNEAYSNIVRYGNIQYAMIENIKNPPAGFETIIRRHFYLKKGEIMEEVRKWVQYAEQRQALYMGLVSDHNSQWCSVFKKSKTQYLEMLKDATAELEKALNSLQQPSIKEISPKLNQRRKKKQQDNQANVQKATDGILNLEGVDVTYDNTIQEQVIDVSNEQVRDRWSRYIGAMGIDAVKKQANAKVLLSGVGSLGVEIAKNVVLSGVGVFAIYDNKVVNQDDLVGQFFLSQSDIGKPRAAACVDKIQQLNNYVRVKVIEKDVQQYITTEQFDIAILTDVYDYNELICWDNLCRAHQIKLIIANANSVYGRIINDFGAEFKVIDKNGEDIPDVLIKSISADGVVELLDGQRSQFADGDSIIFLEVQGMKAGEQSINNQLLKIQTISMKKFKIMDDISQYSPYLSSGIARHVKQTITCTNKSLDVVINGDDCLDANLKESDSIKLVEQSLMHLAYRTLSYTNGDIANLLDAVIKFDKGNFIQQNSKQAKYLEFYLKMFQKTFALPAFPPLAAYLGGFVSQEIIKALTNKFTPINQAYYFDCIEVLPFEIWDEKGDQQAQIQAVDQFQLTGKDALTLLLGEDVYQRVKSTNLFMVGCGAIGCELLKNFAMINLSIEGQITITDPDHIETSNLNRQFLFREKHIHKPKSQTAAAAAIQINPLLKGKLIARMDKVHEQTENIFHDQFFEQLSLVANALDNVQARRYVDRRCVKAKIPLLESGTLGPKGHVQCIIPFQTESYNSMQDPVEEGEIPYCTLKMFPEETFHCIEFARDKFNKLFSLKPKLAQNIIENQSFNPQNPEEIKQLKSTIKLLQQAPTKLEDCIQWAKNKFQKYFINDIKQLLYTYPVDAKTKDGQPFWKLPKRPPKCLNYDIENLIVVQFISTMAFLRAKQYNLPTPADWRQEKNRRDVATLGDKMTSKEWIPNDSKKKEIEEQVLKLENKAQKQQEEEQENAIFDDPNKLLAQLQSLRQAGIKLFSQEFEKDCDMNGHIDFIHSLGNLRALNYGLDEMDWITVKLKAGRIVPALATTTAVVSGLQTIELVKILKRCKLENMKNGFINLAVPMVQLTEPMKAETIKLNEEVNVTLWDRWDVKLGKEITLQILFQHLKQTYHLEPTNVFKQSSVVYMHDLHKGSAIFTQPIVELLDVKHDYVDLVINFVKDEQILKNVPEVRVYFNE
ncbi:unnamed protein product [Paramecium octaurelia]|uniref:UBA domain-containing protein n=1 Tax=Paramecium octaurelia TaxID=43137 RepID=A0A8S1Y4J1_PAROT|nr:unnamed protein product [Paramecium octaurelia]